MIEEEQKQKLLVYAAAVVGGVISLLYYHYHYHHHRLGLRSIGWGTAGGNSYRMSRSRSGGRGSLWGMVMMMSSVLVLLGGVVGGVEAISDEDAEKMNLDSIYTGTLAARFVHVVTDAAFDCLPPRVQFGPFPTARLVIGPNHNVGVDPNLFFFALYGGDTENSTFLASVQSSVTTGFVVSNTTTNAKGGGAAPAEGGGGGGGGNGTWWAVQAWEHTSGRLAGTYEITGAMVKDPPEQGAGLERNRVGAVWKVDPLYGERVKGGAESTAGLSRRDDDDDEDDPCIPGKSNALNWHHTKGAITITGTVSEGSAKISITGTVTLTATPKPKGEKPSLSSSTSSTSSSSSTRSKPSTVPSRFSGHDASFRAAAGYSKSLVQKRQAEVKPFEMEYVLTFTGTHYAGSAPLPIGTGGGMTWSQPGPGPPLPPFTFFNVQAPDSPNSTTTTTTTITTKTPTSTPTKTSNKTSTPTSTKAPSKNGEDGEEEQEDGGGGWGKTKMPKGSIVGIIVGGVVALVVLIFVGLLVKRWCIRRKEPKVYPELAYIYSTPYSTATSKPKANPTTGGGYGAVPQMSGALGTTAMPPQPPAFAAAAAGGSSKEVSGEKGKHLQGQIEPRNIIPPRDDDDDGDGMEGNYDDEELPMLQTPHSHPQQQIVAGSYDTPVSPIGQPWEGGGGGLAYRGFGGGGGGAGSGSGGESHGAAPPASGNIPGGFI
ncbi:hypothetical protein DFH27DRAFT_562530 [Peziza echinospora]|nr:hypothetical protein DFH27DRAFT_562530 [Peziza echinospora]